jgi:pimeloyl-ACP methyl ester carboxylesterase
VATEDRVIPIPHSRALFETWRGAKTWQEVSRASHDSMAGEPDYWRSIAEFLKALR